MERARFVAPKSQDFLTWWATNGKLESQPFTLFIGQPFERRGFYHSDDYNLETTFHEGDIATDTYAAFLSGPLVTSAQTLDLSLLEDDFRMLCVTSFSTFENLEFDILNGTIFPQPLVFAVCTSRLQTCWMFSLVHNLHIFAFLNLFNYRADFPPPNTYCFLSKLALWRLLHGLDYI